MSSPPPPPPNYPLTMPIYHTHPLFHRSNTHPPFPLTYVPINHIHLPINHVHLPTDHAHTYFNLPSISAGSPGRIFVTNTPGSSTMWWLSTPPEMLKPSPLSPYKKCEKPTRCVSTLHVGRAEYTCRLQ